MHCQMEDKRVVRIMGYTPAGRQGQLSPVPSLEVAPTLATIFPRVTLNCDL